MYEIIFWAAIATVVCVVFYSVLGKNMGQGPGEGEQPFDPVKMFDPKPAEPVNAVDPAIESSPFPALMDIAKAEPGFTSAYFLDGAKGAYAMILEAFAEGDKEGLQALLSDKVYGVYSAAIDQREAKNQTQIVDLARIIDAEIVGANKSANQAEIFVEFTAELSSSVIGPDGQTVEGDPDILSRLQEVWTFERNLKSDDLNWRLSDVAPATGDAPEADPSPDTTE